MTDVPTSDPYLGSHLGVGWGRGWCPLETVGVRALKERLSAYLARVRRGEVVTVTDRGVPVARLVPVEDDGLDDLRELASQMGWRWNGGKPSGWVGADAPVLPAGHTASDAVVADRERR